MRAIILACACALAFAIEGNAQVNPDPSSDNIKVVLENERMRVTEYISTPGKDVCGNGKHSHAPHLTVLLSDISVQLITADGEVKNLSVPSGVTFWSEEETHIVRNNAEKGARVLLVELK